MNVEPQPIRYDNIFVVGCQRSGTSVIWACLTGHPDLQPLRGYDPESGYDPKEIYYFRNIFTARKQFRSPMYNWDVDQSYMKDLIEMTVRHCCRQHGAASGRWVGANPADGLHVAELIEAMPEIRVVNVIRHPQEVVWSAVHAPWVEADAGAFAQRVEQSARHWTHFAHVAQDIVSGRLGDSVLLVRHEDVIADPVGVATTITKHVGVSDHPNVVGQLAGPTFNSSFENQAKPAELVAATRRKISENCEFREIVSNVAGKEMEALGYQDLRPGSF